MEQARSSWLVTGILSLSGLVAALNGTIMIPLIPVLPGVLHVTSDDASWLVTVTLVVGAVSIPTVSRLADIHGRRVMLIVCLVVMAAGSAVSALSDSFLVLLVGRALAGFGVPLIPIGISVLKDSMPENRQGTAVALMSATLGIGSGIGLPLSGAMYEALGWHWIFWLTTVVAVLLAVLVIAFVPHTHAHEGGRFDPLGAVLLAIATGSIVLVIAKGGSWGWLSPPTLGLGVAGILALGMWVLVELRVSEPLVDLRVSGSRPVLLTNVAALLVGFGLLINLLLAMQQLQAPEQTGYGFGLTVLEASILMVPGSLLMVVLSPFNGRLLDRTGGRAVLLAGTVIMSGGYVLRTVLSEDVVQVVIGTTVVGLGTSFAYAAMPTIIMNSVPDSMTAAANGLNALLRQVGTSSSSSAVAAALATGTLLVQGVAYASWDTLVALNILAAASCIAAGCVAVAIPRRGLAG